MDADDDQRWLDVLAGRSPPRAGDPVSQQAKALRTALRGAPAPRPAGEPSTDEQRLTQLLARARAQGLLDEPAPPRWMPEFLLTFWATRSGWVAAPALALLLLVSGGLWWWPGDQQPEDPRLRSAAPAVQHLTSANPVAQQTALAEALQSAGAQVQAFERLGHRGLDIELPQPLTPALQQILQQHGLHAPQGTALVIEFDEPPPPVRPTTDPR